MKTTSRLFPLLLLATAGLLAGCERERRLFETSPPLGVSAPPGERGYDRNAWAVAEGKRLYRWYNCNGCHANGGGDIGPPLMDEAWRYGNAPAAIVQTILKGRPNGMPPFEGRMPEDQAWQIASYVRSLSGQLATDVAPSRADALPPGQPEQRRDDHPGRRE